MERSDRRSPADSSVRTGSKASGRRVPRIDRRKCWFRIEVRPSKIHRWGVFALEPIPARRRVIEYTGQKIDANERAHSGKRLLYMFSLTDKWNIDPAIGGSGAEYINHSCDG